MKKKQSKKKFVIFLITVCCIVAGVLVVYYYMMKQQQYRAENPSEATETQKLIDKDLDAGYPETPTEVLKLWGRLNQCLYNTEDLTDEEYNSLFLQLRKMYSSQLLEQNQEDEHSARLSTEIDDFQKDKRKIVSYTADESADVKYKTVDKKECAMLTLSYLVSQKGEYTKGYQEFVLVKEDDKWKVLGFENSAQSAVEQKDKTKK